MQNDHLSIHLRTSASIPSASRSEVCCRCPRAPVPQVDSVQQMRSKLAQMQEKLDEEVKRAELATMEKQSMERRPSPAHAFSAAT